MVDILLTIIYLHRRHNRFWVCAPWADTWKTHLPSDLKGWKKLHKSVNRMLCPLEEHTHNDCMSSSHDTDSVIMLMWTGSTFDLHLPLRHGYFLFSMGLNYYGGCCLCHFVWDRNTVNTVNTSIWVMHSSSLAPTGSYYGFKMATKITDLQSTLGTINIGHTAFHWEKAA